MAGMDVEADLFQRLEAELSAVTDECDAIKGQMRTQLFQWFHSMQALELRLMQVDQRIPEGKTAEQRAKRQMFIRKSIAEQRVEDLLKSVQVMAMSLQTHLHLQAICEAPIRSRGNELCGHLFKAASPERLDELIAAHILLSPDCQKQHIFFKQQIYGCKQGCVLQ